MTHVEGEFVPQADSHRVSARQALADFMVKTALRYEQLGESLKLAPPAVTQEDYDSFMNDLVREDAQLITKFIDTLGGAVEVDYVDPFDEERMRGKFTACHGFNGRNGCWVMSFTNQKYSQTAVPILAQQLPQALNLQ